MRATARRLILALYNIDEAYFVNEKGSSQNEKANAYFSASVLLSTVVLWAALATVQESRSDIGAYISFA